jgi:hypothetical protein
MRLHYEFDALRFAAHLMARCIWIVGVTTAVDMRLEAVLRDIADDFIAKPVPRHG